MKKRVFVKNDFFEIFLPQILACFFQKIKNFTFPCVSQARIALHSRYFDQRKSLCLGHPLDTLIQKLLKAARHVKKCLFSRNFEFECGSGFLKNPKIFTFPCVSQARIVLRSPYFFQRKAQCFGHVLDTLNMLI